MVRVRVGAGVRAWTMHATPDPQPQPGAGARHPVTGRPHGYGEWRDDSYHGECDGMVDSCPPPPSSSPVRSLEVGHYWQCPRGFWEDGTPYHYPYPYPTPTPTLPLALTQAPALARCLRGFWEDGRPVAPFSSREFGSGYAFASVQATQ